MSICISREPGRYSIILKESGWLDPVRFGPEISRALGLPKADGVRACRLQRGIPLQGLTKEQAAAVIALLATGGIDAIRATDTDLPELPRPLRVSSSSVSQAGFAPLSARATGTPSVWGWNSLALIVAGVLMDPAQQAAGLIDRVGPAALDDAEDRRALAETALRKAGSRMFPLAAELERSDVDVGEALEALLADKTAAVPSIEGFGVVETVIDLVFTNPYERLRLTRESRIREVGVERGHIRRLHHSLRLVAGHATSAGLPEATRLLLRGEDAGDYVYEDEAQFNEFCRWAYFWELRRNKP